MVDYALMDYVLSDCQTPKEAREKLQTLIDSHLPDYEQALRWMLEDIPEFFITRSRPRKVIHVNFRPDQSNSSDYPQ
tara:strand:- start:70 stop:300 length:231 start_codon:yes stop_codon:yes gene_type:complete